MSVPAKLTKKQKKGIAFRERKAGKGRSKHGAVHSEDNDVPVLEEQDTLDFGDASVEMENVVKGKKSNPATQVSGSSNPVKGKQKADEEIGKSKKRKRDAREEQDEEVDVTGEGKPSAKRKKSVGEAEGAGEEVAPTPKSEGKQRYILFVGNLKYTTSVDAIKKHFSACDPPPAIRLLTPKSTAGKLARKSKGCAFLEFTHRNALQQALKLHQSNLDGRMINVELTVGGGGKSEKRLEKLKQRNKQLLGQRNERVEKAMAKDSTAVPTLPDRPQRYSATSGVGQAPTTQKTWTVGDEDNGETHRGGRKHVKRSKSRSAGKTWGTGVNAIPVG
ncbi:putative RNA recognition motif containing protein [Lyophyllum shimeji]|uniref:RNA recognition motif containing protein n=1 Tax=Lyophyllum shimeji TaxID=47721 RepID=A0A9P3PHD1_LYOSH|nr:putative RNA recognition motif containing protein [Lyophyllum shimeji]